MASDRMTDAANPRGAAALEPGRLRRRPSPSEHARRVAWGRKFGPLVRAAYQKELERSEQP